MSDSRIIILQMRSLRECMHCGKEFESMKSDFCSDECTKEVSGS